MCNYYFGYERLKFEGEIVEDGREKAQYDVESGLVLIVCKWLQH